MKRTLTALAAAAVVALASTAAPSTADARCFGCAVGAGVLGGVVAGAIVGGAIANSGPGYGPGYAPVAGYEPYEYGERYPVACPGGYWARRPLVDRWGNVVGYSRPRFFCP
jgi:anaerobic selenocysteine-containing dehydrogenase